MPVRLPCWFARRNLAKEGAGTANCLHQSSLGVNGLTKLGLRDRTPAVIAVYETGLVVPGSRR